MRRLGPPFRAGGRVHSVDAVEVSSDDEPLIPATVRDSVAPTMPASTRWTAGDRVWSHPMGGRCRVLDWDFAA